MSGIAITRYILANDATLTATVPGARIFVGDAPVSTQLPAISVRQISGVERTTVAMSEASRFRMDRVQVTVYARTYASKESVLEAVRDALSPNSGSVNGFDLDSITPAGSGPDLDDPDAKIYERSRDFMVSWRT
jgi:hypothetical protein